MANRKSTPTLPAATAVGGIEELVAAERDRILDAMSVLALVRKEAAANEDDDADLYRAIRTAEGLLDRTVGALDSVYVRRAVQETLEAAAEVPA